jgi:DNA-binding transcriptional ArsR family regulator
MNKKKMLDYKRKAEILKALAHPTRLIIIDNLAKRPMCVCEINKLFDLDQSTISKHLSVLKNVSIIEDEKKGMNVFYSLRAPCILKYCDCLNNVC